LASNPTDLYMSSRSAMACASCAMSGMNPFSSSAHASWRGMPGDVPAHSTAQHTAQHSTQHSTAWESDVLSIGTYCALGNEAAPTHNTIVSPNNIRCNPNCDQLDSGTVQKCAYTF
jgi:hypothetical protein